MKVLTTIDLLILPSLETPPTGHIGFGAKSDGLYQKIGTAETKLSVEGHVHAAATQSVAGFMSTADKTKLDGIATGANNYVHPTGAGYNHIPSGGAAGQFLKWSSSGVAVWAADNNTTYGVATTSANGLMSAADKTKLDGVATGANNYSHPAYTPQASGLYKVTVDASGHVSAVAAVAKADITALGIPAQDTTYSASTGLNLVSGAFSVKYGSTAGTAAEGNHTHAYLPLAGGTMANTNLVTNLNADLLDGLHKTAFSQEVHYGIQAGASGYYKINILPATPWMMSFTIRVYQNYQCFDITVSGYNYGANYWHAPNAILSNSSVDSVAVQFGYDSAFNLWVAIPASNYTGLTICNINNGYVQTADWSNNFTITNQATLTGTIEQTIVAKRPLNYDQNAVSATVLQTARTINGVSFDGSTNITITAATPATLTRGGYLTGNNFNGSAATTWAVDATSANTASKVVARDASGNFSAGTITAALSGNATTATTATKLGSVTVGGIAQGIYLNLGTATVMSATVGSATLPVYMNAGVITVCSASLAVSITGNANTATNLSSVRTFAATGDATGSVSSNLSAGFSMALTLAASGVTAGTYRSVTVDAKGRVTAGTNPTTLAGYGITDAVTNNTAQTVAGAKTFSAALTASLSITTPKIIFAAGGWSLLQSGTELLFQYNGVTKQKMLSDGSLVATGEITAYA